MPGLSRRIGFVLGLVAACVGLGWSDADLDLAKESQAGYSRTASRVMVRVIERTDRAALDYLAHDRNSLFHYPTPVDLQPPANPPALLDLTFEGALVAESICDKWGDTPLTEAERAQPLAWKPMVKLLTEWDYDATAGLLRIGSQVSGAKWGNTDLVLPLQQISTVYLHEDQLWVKVEFRPELTWVPADDEDGDGYRELYARVAPAAYTPEVLQYLRGDYLSKPLVGDEVAGFFFKLSSGWYQAMRTVPLKPDESRPWPNAATEPEVREALGGRQFANPFVVIRGEPFGQAIYNVFLLAQAPANETTGAEAGPLKPTDWKAELERWGGTWEAWNGMLADFQGDVRGQLEARPAELRGLVGRDGWLFFRGDLAYLLSGDLREQADGRNPFPAITDFNTQLKARGIDLLLVVIPTKAEVYPEKVSARAPADGKPYVAPYCRKLLGELADAGVGIVDLLPAFLAARQGDEPLYMPQDTHWTNRGVRLAARAIAETVKQRPVLADLPYGSVKYTTREVTCTRLGDICAMLTDEESVGYRPMNLPAQQVIGPDGQPYDDDPTSPLVMLGDSFTGVFQLEDCEHAGLSAHLARELGIPVELIMAQGSGPRIRGQFARRGTEAIAQKKLVVWTVAARDLYNYWAPWDLIKVP